MSTTCLTPGCNDWHYCRGLCRSCYTTAKRLIRNKVRTEEELLKEGKILPSYQGINETKCRRAMFFAGKKDSI